MEKSSKSSSEERSNHQEDSVLHTMTDATDDLERDIQRRLVMLGGDLLSSEDLETEHKSGDENEEEEDIFTPVVQDEPLIPNVEMETEIEKESVSTPADDDQVNIHDDSSVVKPKENALLVRFSSLYLLYTYL